MNKVFVSFLNQGYTYNFANGPDVIRTEQDVKRLGLNCIALMHLLTKQLSGVEIPPFMKGWEMYKDNPYLDNVPPNDKGRMGDIFFFGRHQLPDYVLQYTPQYDEAGALKNKDVGDKLIGDKYAGVHTAMHTGELASLDDPLLIHANKIEGTIAVWPLSKFLELEQYEVVLAIKRAIS